MSDESSNMRSTQLIKKISHRLRRAVSARALPLSGGTDVSPVIVIGSGRSGNTLLRRFLTAGGEIYIPPETYELGRIINDWHRSSGQLGWQSSIALALGHMALSEDAIDFPTLYYRPLLTNLATRPPSEHTLDVVLDAFYQYLATASGSAAMRWGDKTPLNTMHLKAIAKVFPRAQYIWLLRDGYDVTASYLKMGRYSTATEAAHRWATANQACAALEAAFPRQVQRLRYEDMVQSPETVLPPLWEWLGLHFDPETTTRLPEPGKLGDVDRHVHHASVLKPLSTDSVGNGRKKLGSQTVAEIASIIEPVAGEIQSSW